MWQMELDFSQPAQTPDPAIQTSIAQAVQRATAHRQKLNRDGSRKLEDFGEDLGNTRKGRKIGEHLGELSGIRERLAKEPLEQVWPKDSILKLQNPQVAALLWFARQKLPARRPMKTYPLERYINRAQSYIQLQSDIENGTLTADRLFSGSPQLLEFAYDIREPAKLLGVSYAGTFPRLHRYVSLERLGVSGEC